MSDAAKPSMLALLRERAEAKRAQEAAGGRSTEQLHDEIDRRLAFAFQWFDEAVGHLNVLRPVVGRVFAIADVLQFVRPQFDNARVLFRRRGLAETERHERVEVFWRLNAPAPLAVRVKIRAVPEVERRLRGAALQFVYDREVDRTGPTGYGVFQVKPVIAAFAAFRADYARGKVQVALRNVDRFEPVRLEFEPERFDESALEDFIRLLLGESDKFLLRAPLVLDRPRADDDTQEAASETG